MKNPKDNFIIERIRSIKFSLRGIWFLISTESSIKAQLFIVLLISIAGFYFNINTIEWLIQTLAIGLVLVAESLNTGIENVIMLSDFADGNFGKNYGLEIADSAFKNLHSRAVIVINSDGNISYSEQVSEIANEPNYNNALAAI